MSKTKQIIIGAIVSVMLLAATKASAGEVEERIESPVRSAIATRKATQQSEEQWRKERQILENRLAALELEVRQHSDSRDGLARDVKATKERITDKEKELADIQRISSEMAPFLNELVARLEQLPLEDLPFLPEERHKRLARLKKIMRDPEIEVSEKYRKAMEALLVEAEYGLTIETYQQEITIDGQEMLVNIFRLGRLALYYQTLDKTACGFYNVVTNQWQPLESRHNQAIETAIAIAAKQRPAELINMPLGMMVSQ